MNEIDTMPLAEALQKLLRMVGMGRRDAADKLAELLAARLQPEAPPVLTVELPVLDKPKKAAK